MMIDKELEKQEKKWEKELIKLPKIRNLKEQETQEHLRKFYKSYWDINGNTDGISFSVPYYFFTGRRGAWVYWGLDTATVICWHPNRQGQILIYPPVGINPAALLEEILSILPVPPVSLQIARVPLDSYSIQTERVRKATPCAEPVLDWTLAAHVLSTKKVRDKKGISFKNLRTECNKLDDNDIHTMPLTASVFRMLEEVGRKYARTYLERNPDSPLSIFDLTGANRDMLRLSLQYPHLYKNFVFYYKGQPQGFFAWEEFSENYANALWLLYNPHIRGLSYKQATLVCSHLFEKGIEYITLGGSETSGMDFFKTRFRPVQSFDLGSIFIELEETKALPKRAAS